MFGFSIRRRFGVYVPRWGSDAHCGEYRTMAEARAEIAETWGNVGHEVCMTVERETTIGLPFGWVLSRSVLVLEVGSDD
jgi:hypothetical protein